MAILNYQQLMLPLLKSISDGQTYLFRDVIEKLAVDFKLTDKERNELGFYLSPRITQAKACGYHYTSLKISECLSHHFYSPPNILFRMRTGNKGSFKL